MPTASGSCGGCPQPWRGPCEEKGDGNARQAQATDRGLGAELLIIATYLRVRGVVPEALFIGLFSWPWVARAIRAQTFSLRSRDFVDLARLSGAGGVRVVLREIVPNMSSYLFMTFILLFGGAVLTAATLDFIGLGPTEGISPA